MDSEKARFDAMELYGLGPEELDDFLSLEPVSPESFPEAAAGLRGRELAALALRVGEEVLPRLNTTQSRYFEAMSRRAGVQWPEGFFQATIEELTK